MSDVPATNQIFDWVNRFLGDVAEAAQEVDSGLSHAGFVSAYRNGCMWDGSTSIQGSNLWLPRYVLRVYVEPQHRAPGSSQRPPWCGFFAVHLRPTRQTVFSGPVASWGVVSQANLTQPVDIWKGAETVGIARRDPLFLSSPRVEKWQEVDAGLRPSEFELIEYMARPVSELRTANIVRSIVAEPLAARLQELIRICRSQIVPS